MHSVSNLHQHQGAADELRISNPTLLHSLCKEIFKGDARAEEIVKNHFEPEPRKPEIPEKKIVDLVFHPPY